jgi:predicted RNA polymerase sigma factor
MADGPARGLELADQLQDKPALASYPQLPAVRATFLQRLGHLEQAQAEFEQAVARTDNAAERRLYLEQARGAQTEKQEMTRD